MAILLWGFNLGIDFTGGSLVELEFDATTPASGDLESSIEALGFGEVRIQPTEEQGVLIRMRDLDEDAHQRVLAAVEEQGSFTEKRFVSIGPVIGGELKQRAIIALALVMIAIVFYIAWAFRKVSEPVQSWKYGLIAIVALLHDVLIPTGVFAYLGAYHGVEIDALFITALLTILGFSVHDTIVVFDRVRENLKKRTGDSFEITVNMSIRENIIRSINTSITLIFVLITLYVWGGESTRMFALALTIGTVLGTYSSIFIASPLLVTWQLADKSK